MARNSFLIFVSLKYSINENWFGNDEKYFARFPIEIVPETGNENVHWTCDDLAL